MTSEIGLPTHPLAYHVICLLRVAVSVLWPCPPTSDTNNIRICVHHPTWAIGLFTVSVDVGNGQCQLSLSLRHVVRYCISRKTY